MRRDDACLSDYALDQVLAGEGKREERRAHLATCERCAARLAVFAEEKAAFAAAAPALPTRRVFPWPRVLGGLALAASVLLLVAYRPRTEGTRTKGGGGERLGFFVSHGGAVRPGGIDERVQPGDGLRFVVTAAAPRYVAVLSVDGLRHASVYFPGSGERGALVEAGALPESTTLDDALGEETIYGVFCPAPFAIAPLRGELAAHPERPPPAPEGCSIDTLRFRKDAAAPP